MIEHKFKVDEDNANIRLDVFLTRKLEEAPSRTFIQKLIEGGHVQVNGQQERQRYKVVLGDDVSVNFGEDLLPDESELKPEKIPLNIFYEDDAIVVINKPIGM